MLHPEVIRKRLQKLEEYLAILERLRGYGRDEFLSNPERYGSAERFLQLVIESVNDMASHVIAEQGLGEVNASRSALVSRARLYRRSTRAAMDANDWFPEHFGAQLPGYRSRYRTRRITERP